MSELYSGLIIIIIYIKFLYDVLLCAHSLLEELVLQLCIIKNLVLFQKLKLCFDNVYIGLLCL